MVRAAVEQPCPAPRSPGSLTDWTHGSNVFSMTTVAKLQLPGVDRFQLRKPMPKERFDPLAKEIFTLKKQLNAVILAHNYQVGEIQDVADYVGDSLGLAQQAAKTSAGVIVFCGVHFMAGTAKHLYPANIVVLPDKGAGCSLEE